MNKAILSFVFFIPLLFSSYSVNASHYMGADITFDCIRCDTIGGFCEYEIKLVIYRDCRGIAMSTIHEVRLENTACPSLNQKVTLNVDTVIDITPLCPGEYSICSDPRGVLGIERHEFSSTVYIPIGCGGKWNFSSGPWNARNSAISTISPVGDMYITGCISLPDEGCNNVPRFREYPTAFACVGQKTIYNHGGWDPDGDSLSYKFIPCYNDSALVVPYVFPLDEYSPLWVEAGTDVTIDPVSGNIVFKADREQVGILCVEVTEWRDGMILSKTMRDMQYIIEDCDNQIPISSGIDTTWEPDEILELGVCPGQPIDFKICSRDYDSLDIVSMTWNFGIAGASFTVTGAGTFDDRPCGRFMWTPTAADIGTHTFLVTVADDACPIIGSSVKGYIIHVRPAHLDALNDTTVCKGDPFIPILESSVTFDSFSWTPTTDITDPSIPSPILTPGTTTTYHIYASNGYCDAEDSITITVLPDPNIEADQDLVVCFGETVVLNATHDGKLIEWLNTGENTTSIIVTPDTSTLYVVRTINEFGCESFDTVLVEVIPLPKVNAGGPDSICLYESQQINANVGDEVVSWTWDPNIGTDLSIEVVPGESGFYILEVVDSNGCQNRDTFFLTVHELPEPDYKDTSIYLGELLPVGPIGACLPLQHIEWKNLDGTPAIGYLDCPPDDPDCTDPVHESYPWINITEDKYFIVDYLDCHGCPGTDTFLVRVIPEAVLDIPNAFTPNDDGLNDEFYPLIRGPGIIEEFKVFNRWGQLLFETTEIGKGWDGTINGTPQEIGTYVWLINYRVTAETDETFFRTGNVTLIR